MLHRKFHGYIRPPVSKKWIFEGRWGHLHGCFGMFMDFHYPCTWKKAYIQNLVKKWPGSFIEKQVLIFICKCPRPRSRNDLDLQYLHTFINSISSDSTNFQVTRLLYFLKNPLFSLFSYRNPKLPNLSSKGQGQPRVIILTNYDGLESPMLHTKFRGNRSTGSGEQDFWRVYTIYGHDGHLGYVTQMPRTNVRFPYQSRFHIKFGFDGPSGFKEEDV